MKNENKHTKGDWKTIGKEIRNDEVKLLATCSQIYVPKEEAEANAKQIVKCVNMHDDLLQMIRDMKQEFMDTPDEQGRVTAPDSVWRKRVDSILKQSEQE